MEFSFEGVLANDMLFRSIWVFRASRFRWAQGDYIIISIQRKLQIGGNKRKQKRVENWFRYVNMIGAFVRRWGTLVETRASVPSHPQTSSKHVVVFLLIFIYFSLSIGLRLGFFWTFRFIMYCIKEISVDKKKTASVNNKF